MGKGLKGNKELDISNQRREIHNSRNVGKYKSFCVWFTGLPCSGKSSISITLAEKLFEKGIRTYLLDGDDIRTGLNKDLGFSSEDRVENIRRVGEVAKILVNAGTIVLAAFISPYEQDRQRVRNLFPEKSFVEIYIKATVETCEKRDIKGLYKKARAGLLKDFTGITAPYEEPQNPELIICSDEEQDIDKHADKITDYLIAQKYILG
jgi:adenylylsulfate kinase